MIKKSYLLLTMTVFVLLFISACGAGATPVPQIPQSAPVVQNAPTQAPPVAEAPTQQSAPVQAFAPACPSAVSCSAPEVASVDTEPRDTYCVKKIPYQNIMVPPGTTFEAIDPAGDFKCRDSGTLVDGKEVLSCTGKMLWSYQLKLSNPACSGSALATGTGQCQDGFGYDAGQNCCAPLTGGDVGSVTVKVNLGGCPP
jgi:hypothetical protein